MATVLSPAFGPLLRHLRLAAGLSQEALAQRAGLSVRAISDLERGARREPYPYTVQQLAGALRLGAADRARLEAAVPRRQRLAAPVAPVHGSRPVLPATLTRLIGRERDLAAVRRRLAEARLVTLTGAGGVGKSRLALAAVAELAGVDGVHWVELAPLADPALVPAAIAAAVGVRDTPSRPLLDLLVDALAGRPFLLALDNGEHLLDTVVPLVDALLRGCPMLRVLVTSREPLAIPGEVVWPVPSLDVPPAAASVDQIERAAAVQLFVERATAAQPAFQLTAANAAAVAEICRRLDGIPLAIELAAARLNVLTAEQIAARLDDRFALLTTVGRAAPPRQQTLRATLDWSHDLLSAPEQAQLRRLSVFAGGWTLDAAEAIGTDVASAGAVLDLLGRLVAKSLVQVDAPPGGAARYRLLETVRQYTWERLRTAGEETDARQCHAAWCLALAEQAELAMLGAAMPVWFARLDAEHDNVRAALAWLRDTTPESGVTLAGAFWQYWYYRGLYREGQHWLTSLLERSATPTVGRAKALIGAAWLAFNQGDPVTALTHHDAALAVSRAIGDARCTAWALRDRGIVLLVTGEVRAARPHMEEGLALIRQTGDRYGLRASLFFLGDLAARQGDDGSATACYVEALADAQHEGAYAHLVCGHYRLGALAYDQERLDEAASQFEAALAVVREIGTLRGCLHLQTMVGLGRVALRQDDLARASQLLQDSLAFVDEATSRGERLVFCGLGDVPHALAELALRQSDPAAARRWLRQSLVWHSEASEVYGQLRSLETLAVIAAGTGQPTRAARWLAAADTRRVAMDSPRPPIDRAAVAEAIDSARTVLSDADFAVAWAAGQALSLEQAVAEAFENGSAAGVPTTRPASAGMAALTTPAAGQPTNLPAALTSFVGREQELSDIQRLLGATRLLTLTGAGGIGKTRLALAVARSVSPRYADGVWLVELAPLLDPTLAPPAIAQSLGVRETPGQPVLATLLDYLGSRQILLVLDNCEHLVAACAKLADTLLRSCPRVTVLATSREPLGITGEVIWRTPSLPTPPETPTSPEDLAEYAAVRLFVDRARAVQPAFALTPRTAPAVAQICRSLDGIPLAIELAAARLSVLTAEQIAARLDDRFRLLTAGSRTAPPRQQALRATLDWSHALLTTPEQVLLRRLAVFTGGWTLDAAEAVGAAEPIAADAVLDLLTGLAGKSLVVVDAREGEARYRLLETVRSYAWEQLREAGEETAARDRHAAWYRSLAECAELELVGPAQASWFARFDAEADNLRAALAWFQARDPEAGIALAGALWQYWHYRDRFREGMDWLTKLLAVATAPTLGRAKALIGAAWMIFYFVGDDLDVRRHLNEAIALSRTLGDTRCIAWASRDLGYIVLQSGDARTARPLLEDALTHIRQTGDGHGLCATLTFLGQAARLQGDPVQARAYQQESLVEAERAGPIFDVAVAQTHLGQLAFDEGCLDTAASYFAAAAAAREAAGLHPPCGLNGRIAQVAIRQGDLAGAAHYLQARLAAAEAARARGQRRHQGAFPHALGELAWRQGDAAGAVAWLQRSLTWHQDAGEMVELMDVLETLALVAAGTGQPARAVRLLAVTAARRATAGPPLPPISQPDVETALQSARTALGQAAFTTAWAEGQALPLAQVVAEALAPDPEAGHGGAGGSNRA
jgi:non-specific serine/threonine protein kinase